MSVNVDYVKPYASYEYSAVPLKASLVYQTKKC